MYSKYSSEIKGILVRASIEPPLADPSEIKSALTSTSPLLHSLFLGYRATEVPRSALLYAFKFHPAGAEFGKENDDRHAKSASIISINYQYVPTAWWRTPHNRQGSLYKFGQNWPDFGQTATPEFGHPGSPQAELLQNSGIWAVEEPLKTFLVIAFLV
ncbi:hypothetical protein GGX14DRAFT_408636 [Mycena pura]|uniref:Uncharacterized protein n=1 Tax=Mycena pura TaxID=153505 RepID=A0AAD6UKT6_9AGAR|nr:hypothetical protein GGX14DRAFT_408636 [Mycena pura]